MGRIIHRLVEGLEGGIATEAGERELPVQRIESCSLPQRPSQEVNGKLPFAKQGCPFGFLPWARTIETPGRPSMRGFALRYGQTRAVSAPGLDPPQECSRIGLSSGCRLSARLVRRSSRRGQRCFPTPLVGSRRGERDPRLDG